MVGHQAPGQTAHAARATSRRHHLAIGDVVLTAEEHRLPPVTPLGDAMRNIRNDDAGEAGRT